MKVTLLSLRPCLKIQIKEKLKDKNVYTLRYVSVCNFSGLSTSHESQRQASLVSYTYILAPGRQRPGILKFEASLDCISKSPTNHSSMLRPCLRTDKEETFSDDSLTPISRISVNSVATHADWYEQRHVYFEIKVNI